MLHVNVKLCKGKGDVTLVSIKRHGDGALCTANHLSAKRERAQPRSVRFGFDQIGEKEVVQQGKRIPRDCRSFSFS